jgi:hypothetical protein
MVRNVLGLVRLRRYCQYLGALQCMAADLGIERLSEEDKQALQITEKLLCEQVINYDAEARNVQV